MSPPCRRYPAAVNPAGDRCMARYRSRCGAHAACGAHRCDGEGRHGHRCRRRGGPGTLANAGTAKQQAGTMSLSGLAITDGAVLALIDGSRVGRWVDGRAGGLAVATSRPGAEPAAVCVSGPGRMRCRGAALRARPVCSLRGRSLVGWSLVGNRSGGTVVHDVGHGVVRRHRRGRRRPGRAGGRAWPAGGWSARGSRPVRGGPSTVRRQDARRAAPRPRAGAPRVDGFRGPQALPAGGLFDQGPPDVGEPDRARPARLPAAEEARDRPARVPDDVGAGVGDVLAEIAPLARGGEHGAQDLKCPVGGAGPSLRQQDPHWVAVKSSKNSDAGFTPVTNR